MKKDGIIEELDGEIENFHFRSAMFSQLSLSD
jgi:hypothetical protein